MTIKADKILGVNRKIIESFLELIRDKYNEVDEANFFLETKSGVSGVNIGLVNQRDFTSHLCTILKNPGWKDEQHMEQLNAAEEHLRRAIIESYQRSVNIKLITISEMIQAYKENVIPYIEKKEEFKGAPDYEAVMNKLKRIKELHAEGRNAKSQNKWNKKWEKGVKAFMTAFDMAEEFELLLDGYLSKITIDDKPKINYWKTTTIFLSITCIILLIIISL